MSPTPTHTTSSTKGPSDPKVHLEADHDVRVSWPATMIGFVHARDGAAEIFDTRTGDGDGDIEELRCWTCDVDLEIEGLEWA